MRIVHSMEGETKIHIEDSDDYVCTEDNGVSFYPTDEQIDELIRELQQAGGAPR